MSARSVIFMVPLILSALLYSASDVRYENGVNFFQEGKYEEALVRFESLQTDNPDVYQYHQWVGRCHVKMGNPDKARQSFQKAVEVAPGNRQVALDYARVLMKIRDYETMRDVLELVDEKKILKEINQIRAELNTLHYLRGLSKFHLKDYAAAAEDFDAITDPEKRVAISYHHTYSLYREKHYDKALKAAEDARVEDQKISKLVFQILFSALQPGSGVDDPLRYCKNARDLVRELKPGFADGDVTYWAGRTLLACELITEAIPLLKASADGGNVYAAYYLSYALMKVDQLSEALKYMEIAEPGLSGDPDALRNLHCNRGRVYHSKEQFKKALSEYEKGSCPSELIQQASEGVRFRRDEEEKSRLLDQLTCLEGGTICICPKCGTKYRHYSHVDCLSGTCQECGIPLKEFPCS